MNRGDIYCVDLAPVAGREQRGRRPVFVATGARFNDVTSCPVVLPITSGGNFARVRGFTVDLDGHGLKTEGVIRCDQPRPLDLATRKAKFVERAPAGLVAMAMAKLRAIFG